MLSNDFEVSFTSVRYFNIYRTGLLVRVNCTCFYGTKEEYLLIKPRVISFAFALLLFTKCVVLTCLNREQIWFPSYLEAKRIYCRIVTATNQSHCSVVNVVRLIWPWSDYLTFWPKVVKIGQILTKKDPKSQNFESQVRFSWPYQCDFCLYKMYS